jgi:hypothetical protein
VSSCHRFPDASLAAPVMAARSSRVAVKLDQAMVPADAKFGSALGERWASRLNYEGTRRLWPDTCHEHMFASGPDGCS